MTEEQRPAEQPNKRRVLIALPAFDGQITIQLAEFLIQSAVKSMDPAYPFSFSTAMLGGISPVDYARNKLSQIALRDPAGQGCELIWWLDSDMIPPPNIWDMLTACPDADLVSGLYFNFGKADYGGPGTLAIIYTDYDPATCKWTSLRQVSSMDPLPITGCGGGCLLMKRRVLEDPRMQRPGAYTDVEGRPREMNDGPFEEHAPALWSNQYVPNGRVHVSEDLDFCLRAQRLGYTIYAMPGVQFGHRKTVDVLTLLPFAQHVSEKSATATRESFGIAEVMPLIPIDGPVLAAVGG